MRVRKAGKDDLQAVTALLYESSPEIYDRFAGNRERAMRILAEAFGEPGNVASAEVAWLAEDDGRTVAAMAAFPIAEGPERARAFTRLALRRLPFWLWGRTLRLYTAGTRAPRDGSLYIDALATDAGHRRRGPATALIDVAERQARELGLSAVALDTTIENSVARAFYAGAGFDEVAYRAASRSLPGFVALVRPVGR